MAPFLRDPFVYNHDIIVVLEPWLNLMQYTTYNPLKGRFPLIFGTADQARTRVAVLSATGSRHQNGHSGPQL